MTNHDLAPVRRMVVKLGTQVVLNEDGRPAFARLFGLLEAIADLRRQSVQVLLVSSGATALGLRTLEGRGSRRAAAAVGQAALMSLYQEGSTRLGLSAAQVLVTPDDFRRKARRAALGETLETLLACGMLPVLNENDPVSPGGAPFSDNDALAALVAMDLKADLLVLLTNVDGLFTANPDQDPLARPIREVAAGGSPGAAMEGLSQGGRGGMASKVASALKAARSGVRVVLASGHDPLVLARLQAGESAGTCFHPTRRLA